MVGVTGQASIVDRMIRAARLEPQVYEEVEHDQSATGQAMLVVVLGAVAAGIGALYGGVIGLIVGIITAIVGWAVYALVAYWVGTNLFKGPHTEATWGQLLRTLGFASSPRVLLVLGIIPVVGILIGLAVFVWTLITTVIAIRQALDFDTGKAIITAVVSWLALLVVSFVITAIVASAI
jgi:tetrahydromethanopterin S-methyltransferase subunit G